MRGMLCPHGTDAYHIEREPRGRHTRSTDRAVAYVYWAVKSSLTTFSGSPCWNNVNGSKSSGRIDQEYAMTRPSEIAEDKVRAILALIGRIDEQIGTKCSSKPKKTPASKLGASRPSD
jgi:hypothetical protein